MSGERVSDDAGILRLVGAVERTIDMLGRATAWLTLAIVLVVALNVIMRYLFRFGPVAMQEMEWHLISPIALIGMSYGLLHNEHVRVDFIYERYGPRARLAIDLVAAVVTVIICVVVVKVSWPFVSLSYIAGEGSPDPGGLPYRWALKTFVPFGFALLGLQAMAIIVRNAMRLASGRDDGS